MRAESRSSIERRRSSAGDIGTSSGTRSSTKGWTSRRLSTSLVNATRKSSIKSSISDEGYCESSIPPQNDFEMVECSQVSRVTTLEDSVAAGSEDPLAQSSASGSPGWFSLGSASTSLKTSLDESALLRSNSTDPSSMLLSASDETEARLLESASSSLSRSGQGESRSRSSRLSHVMSSSSASSVLASRFSSSMEDDNKVEPVANSTREGDLIENDKSMNDEAEQSGHSMSIDMEQDEVHHLEEDMEVERPENVEGGSDHSEAVDETPEQVIAQAKQEPVKRRFTRSMGRIEDDPDHIEPASTSKNHQRRVRGSRASLILYKCGICKKTPWNVPQIRDRIREHIKAMHKLELCEELEDRQYRKTYRCRNCKKMCKNKGGFTSHLQKHIEPATNCAIRL